MNNYITIYVTSRMLVDALMEYVDDIANENFDIELSKDEVEIHVTKVSDLHTKKRLYQDIENLLDCGISVISSCNLRVFERVNQRCEKSSNIDLLNQRYWYAFSALFRANKWLLRLAPVILSSLKLSKKL